MSRKKAKKSLNQLRTSAVATWDTLRYSIQETARGCSGVQLSDGHNWRHGFRGELEIASNLVALRHGTASAARIAFLCSVPPNSLTIHWNSCFSPHPCFSTFWIPLTLSVSTSRCERFNGKEPRSLWPGVDNFQGREKELIVFSAVRTARVCPEAKHRHSRGISWSWERWWKYGVPIVPCHVSAVPRVWQEQCSRTGRLSGWLAAAQRDADAFRS